MRFRTQSHTVVHPAGGDLILVNLNDHPIHPMLVDFPIAYLVGGALVSAWASATHRPAWFRTARHMRLLGLWSACAAALPGLVDYVFAVPPRSSAKQRATNHMVANVSALTLFGASLATDPDEDARPAPWRVGAELCGAGLLGVAGWLGGTLVYRNQIAVDHLSANAGRLRIEAHPLSDTATGLVDVASDDELAVDQMKLLRIGSRRVVLARTQEGYAAFDDSCTHKGGPLADGALVCGTVQCPWHGSQFDVRTGAVRQGPASQAVKTYDVEQSGGRVRIRVG